MTHVSNDDPKLELNREAEADAASEELPKALESARTRMESWLTLFGMRRKPEPRSAEPRSWESDE
jgi:hypothetical protein